MGGIVLFVKEVLPDWCRRIYLTKVWCDEDDHKLSVTLLDKLSLVQCNLESW